MQQTDIVVLVLDAFRLLNTPFPSSILRQIHRRPLQIVVNGPLPRQTDPAIISQNIRRQYAEIVGHLPAPPIAFVQAELALAALDVFSTSPSYLRSSSSQSRASAVDTFQQQYLASRFGPFQQHLLDTAARKDSLQFSTARDTAMLALADITAAIQRDRDSTKAAHDAVVSLRRVSEDAARRAKHLSVTSRGIEGAVVEGGIQHEMTTIRADIDNRFHGRWTWLNLIGRARVNDVGPELANLIDTQFGRHLEREVRRIAGPS